MLNKLFIGVITHERPKQLLNCLNAFQQIKANDFDDAIEFQCIDNSVIYSEENRILLDKYPFRYIQQPGATQMSNFQKALEIAKNYSFCALVHDDDILLQDNIDLTEIKNFKKNELYFFKSIFFNSRRRIAIKHNVNAISSDLNKHLVNFFPHRMPLFPSYIYPNQTINFLQELMRDKQNIHDFGKYNDTAAIAAIISKFNLEITPFNAIYYLYIAHPGQDSSTTCIKQKIKLFKYLKNVSNVNWLECLYSVVIFSTDIIKSFFFNFFIQHK